MCGDLLESEARASSSGQYLRRVPKSSCRWVISAKVPQIVGHRISTFNLEGRKKARDDANDDDEGVEKEVLGKKQRTYVATPEEREEDAAVEEDVRGANNAECDQDGLYQSV